MYSTLPVARLDGGQDLFPTRLLNPVSDVLPKRLLSVDVLRGTTMALMLLVDVCGDTIPFFSHSTWHGITLADFVMPSFLFIVGASINLSISGSRSGQSSRASLSTALRRSARLFLLGVVVQGQWIPSVDDSKSYFGFDLEKFRIMGILQRIAICYFIITAVVVCIDEAGMRHAVVFGLLAAQVLIMAWIQVPGCDSHNDYSMECNAEGWLDRMILGRDHLYRPADGYDPEGLVATLGCVFTTYIGYLALTRPWQHGGRRLLVGSLLILVGFGVYLAGIPFNKSLWTLSYNLATVGAVLVGFAACDSLQISSIDTNPLGHLGTNAILFYLLSDCCGAGSVMVSSIWVTRDNSRVSLITWFKDSILQIDEHPNNVLIFAMIELGIYFRLMRYLYQRRMFLKV